MISFDTQRAFIIPAEKQVLCAKMICNLKLHESIDADADPLIVFNLESISKRKWELMYTFLNIINAKEVTESLTL